MRRYVRKGAILWSDDPAGVCVACRSEVGDGPVGVRLKEPTGFLCDACMIDCDRGLGMLLMAANVLREIANQQRETDEQHDVCSVELMVFARMYDTCEQHAWNRREVGWRQYLEKLAAGPVETLLSGKTAAN